MQATFNAEKNIILPHRLREVFLEKDMISDSTREMLIKDRESHELVIDLSRTPTGILNRSEIDRVPKRSQTNDVQDLFGEFVALRKPEVSSSTDISSLFGDAPTTDNDDHESEFDSSQLDKLWEKDDTFIQPISLENEGIVHEPVSRIRRFGRKALNFAKRNLTPNPQRNHERKFAKKATIAIVGGIALLGLAGGLLQNSNEAAQISTAPTTTTFDISDYEVEITSSPEEQMAAFNSPEFRAIVERPEDFERMMRWVEANPDKDLNAYFLALERNT